MLADIQPRGSNQNYSQKSLSNAGNPASAALTIKRQDPYTTTGASIEIGGGIEYGNFDDLFAKIDELALLFSPPDNDDTNTLPSGEEQPSAPNEPNPKDLWDDFLIDHPEVEERLDIIKDKVALTAGLLAVITSEGYAKAEVTSDMSFVLNENLFGGTLLFGTSFKGNSKAVGIFDDFNLDLEQAIGELSKIPQFTGKDKIQALKLSDGILLFYNPANQHAKMVFDNDSLLLVKATKIAEVSLSYSRNIIESDDGDLYLGVKPIFYRVGLTNVGTRIGEITDTNKLFEKIKDADFIYENGFDADIGIVWAAENYQLGTSITNIFKHTYDFPELEDNRFRSDTILNQLSQHETYTMDRQWKLEAGIFTKHREWSLYTEIDANPVSDPMGDDYQWFTLTAGYAADSWWLPSARIGMSRNLAGTGLGYINAGVTVMKYLNIDAATTIDTVTLDGAELRRGVNIRVGVQFDY